MDTTDLLSRLAQHLETMDKNSDKMNVRSCLTIFTYRDTSNPSNSAVAILNVNDMENEPDHLAVAFSIIRANTGVTIVQNIDTPIRRMLAAAFSAVGTNAIVAMDGRGTPPATRFSAN